jgi:hypothetical protein
MNTSDIKKILKLSRKEKQPKKKLEDFKNE